MSFSHRWAHSGDDWGCWYCYKSGSSWTIQAWCVWPVCVCVCGLCACVFLSVCVCVWCVCVCGGGACLCVCVDWYLLLFCLLPLLLSYVPLLSSHASNTWSSVSADSQSSCVMITTCNLRIIICYVYVSCLLNALLFHCVYQQFWFVVHGIFNSSWVGCITSSCPVHTYGCCWHYLGVIYRV